MRKFLLLIIFVGVVSSIQAQTVKTADQKTVDATITKLFDGIAELDFAKIKSSSTSDVLILESGVIWNLDSLINRISPLKNVDFKRTNELNFISTEVRGNTAWVIYDNIANMTINGQQRKVNWLESAVLVKEGNEWKVKMLHSTTIQPK